MSPATDYMPYSGYGPRSLFYGSNEQTATKQRTQDVIPQNVIFAATHPQAIGSPFPLAYF